jgi:O-methyltransferase
MFLFKKITNSRFFWFIKGLPDVYRAHALFSIRKHTMTSAIRSKVLWNLCRYVFESGIPGDFVECGVWRGGSAGLMGLALKHFSQKRDLHLFDSFEGLPEPSLNDGPVAFGYSGGVCSGNLVSVNKCAAELNDVKHFLFREMKIPEKSVFFYKGWFQDTIPNLGKEPRDIAILRLDGDWYESTKICLESLFNRVVKGGVILIDDYFCWEGCRKATDEFLSTHGIAESLIQIDKDSAYFIKN